MKGREKVSGKILITNNALGYVWNFFFSPFLLPFNASQHCQLFFLFWYVYIQLRPSLCDEKGFSLALILPPPKILFFILFSTLIFPLGAIRETLMRWYYKKKCERDGNLYPFVKKTVDCCCCRIAERNKNKEIKKNTTLKKISQNTRFVLFLLWKWAL